MRPLSRNPFRFVLKTDIPKTERLNRTNCFYLHSVASEQNVLTSNGLFTNKADFSGGFKFTPQKYAKTENRELNLCFPAIAQYFLHRKPHDNCEWTRKPALIKKNPPNHHSISESRRPYSRLLTHAKYGSQGTIRENLLDIISVIVRYLQETFFYLISGINFANEIFSW